MKNMTRDIHYARILADIRKASRVNEKVDVKPCNGYLLTICATCGAWIEGQPDYCPECGTEGDD